MLHARKAVMSGPVGLDALPPEVLRDICQRLFRDPPEDNGLEWPNRKTTYVGIHAVLALTRTSRVIHEHALNALWDTLPGYGCLVFTLPSDAWTTEEKPRRHQWNGSDTEHNLSIVRPLVDADLVRFHHYAPRIKRILDDPFDRTFPQRVWRNVCQSSVLDAFSTYFSATGRTAFPNLGVLHVTSKAEDPVAYYRALPMFFNRNLRNIADKCSNIKKGTDLSTYQQMLSKLQEISPDLLFFNTHSSPWFAAMASALSDTLPGFQQLVSVHVTLLPLTPKAVLHLATLPNLTDAGFKIDENHDAETRALFANTSDKRYFRRLRTLSVTHQRNASIPTVLLRAISSSNLSIVRVSVNDWEIPVQEVKDLLSTIANRSGYGRLRSVKVAVHGVVEKDGKIDEDDLTPFYKLQNLTDLELTISAPFTLSDDILRIMASSWRKMRKLHLGGPGLPLRRVDDDRPLVTLAGLIPFAQLCPHLHTLALPLRPVLGYTHAHPNADLVRPSFGRPHRALRMLHVGYSKIEERQVLRAAGFLSDVFPKVDIDCDWPFEENAWDEDAQLTEAERDEMLAEAVYRDRWNRVAWTLVPALAKIRKQERRWGLVNGMTIPTVRVFEE